MRTKALTLLAVLALTGASSTAAQVQQPAPAAKAPEATAPTPAAPRPAAPQLLNIKLEVTITDQRDGLTAAPRTVTMLLQDRENGRLRADQPAVNAKLGIDARPEILSNGRTRVQLTVDYRPQAADGEKIPPSTLSETVTAILEDGKPLVVSQSTDATSSRAAVKVELKATVLR